MRFGLAVPHFGPTARAGFIEHVAREAEAMGFDSLWASDHVMVPPGVPTPHFFYDVFVTMGAMIAVTTRTIVGASVVVLPYRDPRPTARTVATLDQLSGGRVVLGVGAGGLEPEFRGLEVDYHQRGAITDEYIDCMRALWTQDPATFEGRFVRFREMRQNPRPAQQPLPLPVGGNSAAALRRAATRGNGWQAINLAPEVLAAGVAAYRVACAAAGTAPGPVSMRSMANWGVAAEDAAAPTADALAARLRDYADAGLDEMVFGTPVRTADQYLGMMRLLAEQVRPLLAG